MIDLLTRILELFAALLVKVGIPDGQSTLYALILIYLLVTVIVSAGLLVLLLRRRQRAPKRVSPLDTES